MIKNHDMAKGLDHKLALIPTLGIFDKPLIGQIYIYNWIDKRMFYKN